MQFALLLQLCLLGLGLAMVSPGRRFLMRFPPYNDPAANVTYHVTVIATGVPTSVTVKVLETAFEQRVVLSAGQAKTVQLPLLLRTATVYSSFLLSVTSAEPVLVLALFCNRAGCDHSLLHGVSSWGTRYYPITPLFPNQTVVSHMVITSAHPETTVDISLSGEVLYNGDVYARGSLLKLRLEALLSVCIKSNSSLSGSEINSNKAVGVVVGFTCSKQTPGDCLYAFADLKPVSHWNSDFIIIPSLMTVMSPSSLFAMATVDSVVVITTNTSQTNVPLVGGIMGVIPVVSGEKAYISSDNPVQFLLLVHNYSTLSIPHTADEICQIVPVVYAGVASQHGNGTRSGDLMFKVTFELSPKTNLTTPPDNAELGPSQLDTAVGSYLSGMTSLRSALCEKTSCDDLHCGHKRDCLIKDGKPLCSPKTKICSAWGDSYYRMFNGRDFVLHGNCNYTLVQTTCAGTNDSLPLQINIARAFLNGDTISVIHTVEISIEGINVSIVKDDKNHVRVNGQKRNLPLSLGDGSVNLHPSGSGVVVETIFGLALHYDWKHHLQVAVGPELYGRLCGLCGNADHSSAPNGSANQTVDFHLQWLVGSGGGVCSEECGGSVPCPVCIQSQTNYCPGPIGNSLEEGCALLQRSDGPFAPCHSYIDPQPFVSSCVNSICVSRTASSMCKVLTAYANSCQRLGARIQNWKTFTKCSMTCPLNSHYEICGSACPATCGNPEAHHHCTLPCVDSCQCNRGYLLSGGQCVPQSKCGCLHQGSYHLPKENFMVDRQCQEKCVCQPNSRRIMCARSPCRNGEVCTTLNGVLGCHADGPAMCVAKGDPHYTTFDGQNFDVHGNCSYLLTSHCPCWGSLEDFSVEVENHMSDAGDVSFRRLKITVSGYSIEVSNDWSDRMEVNGLLVRLPSVLSRGKVKLSMAGLSKCIETDFGMVVTHSPYVLTVKMPRVFSGNLCGLCGNLNGNPDDDMMPDEDSDVSEAISYWRTSNECVYLPVNTSACNLQEMARYQGKDFCGRLLDKEGAFQNCHEMVDAQDFYDNCVKDLCYGNRRNLCQILAGYVAVCQETGVMVDDWRASDFCDLPCPPNSEYNLCSNHSSECVENPSLLAATCKEGCFCKAGFFHSGGKCVPDSECGCIYNGIYHEIDERFIPDEHCRLDCVCAAHNIVQCANHTCSNGTQCVIQDGDRACHALPADKCSVMGGRHFRNYDGRRFDFDMGHCRFVLSQVCAEEDSHPVVVVQQGELHLRTRGMNLSLEREHSGKVKINGVLRRLPVQLDHLSVVRFGSLTRVVVDKEIVVIYEWPNLIHVEIPASHGKMCGLCGNAVAVTTDDGLTPSSNLANNISLFASSWSLSLPGTSCSPKCDLCLGCDSTGASESASHICGILVSPIGLFRECHSTVDPEPFFQNCVNDFCVSNGNNSLELFCSSLREYTFACQQAGAKVRPWRSENCSISCPANSHYGICVSACPESCGISSDIHCPWPCSEGCQCDSGYVQSGNGCVRAEQCGCAHQGHYYEIGEMFWAKGCSEQCNCSAPATVSCVPASCPERESCTLNDTWGCVRKAMSCPLNSHYESCGTACPATCENPFMSGLCTLPCVETCQCEAGFVHDGDTCIALSQCGCTHNGNSYHSNQTFWADEGCTERCVCDPGTHRTRCRLDSCEPDEYCGLQDGVGSCVPLSQKTCMYTGHHIFTFDHYDYDFHGTCQYQLLSLCGPKEGLDPIQVHVQTDGHLESELHVLVYMSGVLVKLDSKNSENIEVDGVGTSMPYHFSTAALAFSSGLHTYIYTDLGFEISLSIGGILRITLSHKYANATCGLCGNFNSDPADDLAGSGTQVHLTPEDLGKAWRSGQSPWCVEGCLGGSCPTCSSEHLTSFSEPEACGKILEVNGPFRDCHAEVDPSHFYSRCLRDLCVHGGLQQALCHSLAEYAAVCFSHKAIVYAWRIPGFCYLSCPSSTSYNTSFASAHLCLGWHNTVEVPLNAMENCLCEAGLAHSGTRCVYPENCGCFHHGEYLVAGQEVSTCKQRCVCRAGGHVACLNVSCGENETCTLIRGVQGCHPKPRVALCSVDGSQYSTFDGRAFEFHGSCNYTLVQMCPLKKLDVDPVVISARGGNTEGRQIHLQVNDMHLKMSLAFDGKILVNGLFENLPFFQNNVTANHKNGWIIIKTPQSVELMSDLQNHIRVKLPDSYHQTTCGLCGTYNDYPQDDLQLPNGTVVSGLDIFGHSWKLLDNDSNCSDAYNGTRQLCSTPVPEYTSGLHCGLLTHPGGPFASCHRLVSPQKCYSNCMKNLCLAKGQHQALCDALSAYEAACRERGGRPEPWKNATGCSYQCPEFSHYSQCANVCSSLCPEISGAVECPRDCEEGCSCAADHPFDGHACVPAEQCGCAQDGRRFKVSESKLLQNCTVNCTCGPPFVCDNYSCPSLHSCMVKDGIMDCHKDEPISDPCEGICDDTEECSLVGGEPVCKSHQGLCWTWGGQYYHAFDGLSFDFEGNCTYMLAASKGPACGLQPFSVSKKNDRIGGIQVVTVQAYGLIIQLSSETSSIHVNGQLQYIPVDLLRGKLQVSHKDGKTQLKTDFGLHVVHGWNSTVVLRLDPRYKAKVYGLCGNFDGHLRDAHPASVDRARAYQLYDGDQGCCTGCDQNLRATTFPVSHVYNKSSLLRMCAVLRDPNGTFAQCHRRVSPDSFYEGCVVNRNGLSVAPDQALKSYSTVCEEYGESYYGEVTADVHCPPNSHYETCGSACPPSCESNATVCHKACAQGCFCHPGFIQSPQGCVRPHQCGCADSTGKYHSLNSTFWIPDDCGQMCLCGPAGGEVQCRPARCPGGMVCKQLRHNRVCQREKPKNCTVVTGLHFTTFDGHHFDFRDGCAYSLVQTNLSATGLAPFNITISDASCHRRLFHSLTITLSIYGLEVAVRKDDPGKVLVDGQYKALPYSHQTGHVNAYYTPLSLVINTDVGLQLIIYKNGALTVDLPSGYGSSVSGLCGNANDDPRDDHMSSEELAHRWRSGPAETCTSNCSSGMKDCPVEAQELYEGREFCGVLLDRLGPFADCASVLSPKPYFHSCVVDSCSFDGHYSSLCNPIASYAAACQAARQHVGQWRSDTFCGMSCPKNSHYELCGPRCPAVCTQLSSSANCSGGCEEGCQCDPGYVLSDGRCVLVSDCGCMHEGHYRPAGQFYSEKSCQTCNCTRGRVTCSPVDSCPVKDVLGSQRGVCQVFAGFGYITFDGVILPHHGACTYLVSALSSKTIHDYSLLLSFRNHTKGIFTISRIVFNFLSSEVSVDPLTLWKIQVNGEERSVPFDCREFTAYQVGSRLVITTPSGVGIDLSSTQYLRLTVPQVYDATASGLCGNFNGDKYDDAERRDGLLAASDAELLRSWAVVAPGAHCHDTCGKECAECTLSPQESMLCDILSNSIEFNQCWNGSTARDVYRDMCMRAVCAGAGHKAVCLALEAYSAACQTDGIPVGPWRDDTHCSLQCPDGSSQRHCVDPSSNSCPALLQPGSVAAGCSEGCQCSHGKVFDGSECVSQSRCGCFHQDLYIKVDEKLYTDDCSQICWCHTLGGVVCERAACNAGQQCVLRNGSWGCRDGPEVCTLHDSLRISKFNRQQLVLQPEISFTVMSLCDEASVQWFSLVSYHGRCNGSSSRLVTVFQVLFRGSSVAIQDGMVKVNGQFVSLPYTPSFNLSLSSGVSRDKSEVVVILRRDAGTELELEMEIGVTMVTVKVPLWYSGKLCGVCGNISDPYSYGSGGILSDVPGCGFTG